MPAQIIRLLIFCIALCLPTLAAAHNITAGDAGYVQEIWGPHPVPFAYLGAKHMITGYDHILFLVGVVFFLYRLRDVALYVSLFAIGHSITMLPGVLLGWQVNPYLIDAIIGFSIVYKALDNLGFLHAWFGFQPDTRAATLIFGLFHGLGLATKLLDYDIASEGLLINLIAFNVGVEIGQILALAAILIMMGYWRRTGGFRRHANAVNVVLMILGFLLIGYQLSGYMQSAA